MTINPYKIRLQAKDCECDMHGIVHHSVYFHYLEHARNSYIAHQGISFTTLTKHHGITVVVYKAAITYYQSLLGMDEFDVTVDCKKTGRLAIDFTQTIYRQPDNTRCLDATVTTVARNKRGRPHYPALLDELLFGKRPLGDD